MFIFVDLFDSCGLNQSPHTRVKFRSPVIIGLRYSIETSKKTSTQQNGILCIFTISFNSQQLTREQLDQFAKDEIARLEQNMKKEFAEMEEQIKNAGNSSETD